jgi:hypothetical protein
MAWIHAVPTKPVGARRKKRGKLFLAEQVAGARGARLILPSTEGACMFRRSTITVAAIAACGVTLALGASVVVLPRFVHPLADVAPAAEQPSPPKISPRPIPHKFMRPMPNAP